MTSSSEVVALKEETSTVQSLKEEFTQRIADTERKAQVACKERDIAKKVPHFSPGPQTYLFEFLSDCSFIETAGTGILLRRYFRLFFFAAGDQGHAGGVDHQTEHRGDGDHQREGRADTRPAGGR